MNTANLQLEGVYAVLAALFGALRDKGLLAEGEIDALLAGVEQRLASDPQRPQELREANIDAICFPARFLRLALGESAAGEDLSFARLTARVGREKAERGREDAQME
ncbi:hypothetical protein [Methylosinus sp. Sm6]|uniref:hypothetical protein n=1 Tax=Methylosinus sp. Sm6 TaxID=2866948 RepID=UPI001C99998D|nr:hypothetical protein [Methylosinus sp. Sm6]MBY6240295.1 hypothetical protein [Methylosinus sp. Sm6]